MKLSNRSSSLSMPLPMVPDGSPATLALMAMLLAAASRSIRGRRVGMREVVQENRTGGISGIAA